MFSIEILLARLVLLAHYRLGLLGKRKIVSWWISLNFGTVLDGSISRVIRFPNLDANESFFSELDGSFSYPILIRS